MDEELNYHKAAKSATCKRNKGREPYVIKAESKQGQVGNVLWGVSNKCGYDM